MGCSARRLSSTRSGTVGWRRLVAAILRLSLTAPIPPLALLGRKKRIEGLGHGCGKDVLAADVDALPGNAAEPLVKPRGILPRKLLDAANSQKLEVAQHGRSYGDQILEPPVLCFHVESP